MHLTRASTWEDILLISDVSVRIRWIVLVRKTDQFRIIYENDYITVCHQIKEFESGAKEAVMMVYQIKDGQIYSMETGATPISS